MCAAMLTFEALLLGLSVPVMIAVEDVPTGLALGLGLGLAALCIVTAGMLTRPWGYTVGHVLQVAAISLGFLVPAMFFVGGLFGLLWLSAYLLGRKIEDDKRRWAAEGPDAG